ncbi:hypothetical protein JCM1841_002559 [Sporobolomyces salmonicolor]
MDWEEEDRKPNTRSRSPASSRSPSPVFRAASASDPDRHATYDAVAQRYQEDTGFNAAQYAGDDYEDESCKEEPLEQPMAARRRREGEAVPDLFAEHQVLPEEGFASKTVRELYDMVEAGTINLNPAYQRDVVWKEDICQGLIGSIFRNMHIPEILFNVYTPDADDLVPATEQHDPGEAEASSTLAAKEKGKEREKMVPRLIWNCADGKQRLTALRKFMNDQYYIKVDGSKLVKYSTMPAAARAIFDRKRLRFGFYRELNDQQEREIFTRVQLGKRLSKAEEANAITSDYKTWIDQLVKEYAPEQQEDRLKDPRVFAPRITNFTRNKALVIIFAAAHSFLRGYKKAEHYTEIQRRNIMTNDDRPSAADRARVKAMFDRLRRLSLVKALRGDKVGWPKILKAGDPRQNMTVPHRVWWRHKAKAGISPVEFQFIPLLLQKHEALSDGDMLEVIERFRDAVAEKHAGNVSDNVTVFRTMLGFLERVPPLFSAFLVAHRLHSPNSAAHGLGSTSTSGSAATRASGASSPKKKDTLPSSGAHPTNGASSSYNTKDESAASSHRTKDKSASSSYGTDKKSKRGIDAPAPRTRPSTASTRPEPTTGTSTLPHSSQRQAPSQSLKSSDNPFSLPFTSNTAQPSSSRSHSHSLANAHTVSTDLGSFFGLPLGSPPRSSVKREPRSASPLHLSVKREPRSASPPHPSVKRDPRNEDPAIAIPRPGPPLQPPFQGISAKRKVLERLAGGRVELPTGRPSSALGSTSQANSNATLPRPSGKRGRDSSRGDMSGFDDRGRPITRRPAADDEDDMFERFGGRGDDDIVAPAAEEHERASKRPREDDKDEAVIRVLAGRAGGGARGGSVERRDVHSSADWEREQREREQRERERDQQMWERLGLRTGGSDSRSGGSGGTYSRDGRGYPRDPSLERTNGSSRPDWRMPSTRCDESEKRRSSGGDGYRDARPSDGGWGMRASHLEQQRRPRQSSATSDSNGVSFSLYDGQRGSTAPMITYPDIPSVSYPAVSLSAEFPVLPILPYVIPHGPAKNGDRALVAAIATHPPESRVVARLAYPGFPSPRTLPNRSKMTNLITSLLQIVQGFINAILSLLETVLSLFKTFVEDVVILAKSTVEFFLKNIVVLGVVAVVFVGFSVLQQRNHGGVRPKAQGLKKQM